MTTELVAHTSHPYTSILIAEHNADPESDEYGYQYHDVASIDGDTSTPEMFTALLEAAGDTIEGPPQRPNEDRSVMTVRIVVAFKHPGLKG